MDDDKAFWDWVVANGGIENVNRILDTPGWGPETTQGTPIVRTPAERREALRGTPEWKQEYLANLDEPKPEPEAGRGNLGWYHITIPEEDEDEAE